MLIKYECEKCKKTRAFTKVKEEVVCECGEKMKVKRNETSSAVLSTPEARYLGDEALFNTIGDRLNNQHKTTHILKKGD